MDSINNIIKDILLELGFINLYYTGVLKQNWENIVGNLIASVSIPDRIERNILYIKCNNPSWKQELYFFKDEILEKVNSFIGENIVKDVKIFFHKIYNAKIY